MMRIIVYGSLRREQGNCRWMTHAMWLGDCQLTGYELYDLGHYPAVVPGEGTVYCEVYRINATILAELDELKNHPWDYKRELVTTEYGSAWLYVYQRPVDQLDHIESGDWLLREE